MRAQFLQSPRLMRLGRRAGTTSTVPTQNTAPTIDAPPQKGVAVTVTDGTYSGTPAPAITAYRWQISDDGAIWADIVGEVGATYTPLFADVGKYVRRGETAANAAGSIEAFTAASAPVVEFSQSALGYYLPARGNAADAALLNENGGTSLDAMALHLPNSMNNLPVGLGLIYTYGVTYTRNAADGPVAGQRAMNAVSTDTSGRLVALITLPAGTYTLAEEVRADTPVDIRVGHWNDNAVKAVTSSWTTVSHTFTHAGGAISIQMSGYSTAAYNVEIANVRLSKGTSDLGLDTSLPLVFEESPSDPKAPPLTTAQWRANAMLMFQERRVFDACSFVAQVDCGATATSYNRLFQLAETYADLTFYFHGAKLAMNLNGVTSQISDIGMDGVGRTIVGLSVSATQFAITRNGLPIHIEDRAFSPVTTAYAAFPIRSYMPNDWSVGTVSFWDMALTAAELGVASIDIADQANAANLAIEDFDVAYYGMGDSITDGNGTLSYADQALEASGNGFGRVIAVPGDTIAEQDADADIWIPYWTAAAQAGRRPIVSMMIGANDFTTLMADPSAYYTTVMATVAKLRAAGCVVIMCDILPRAISGFNVARGVFNALLAANEGTDFDYHCDFSGTTTGTDGSEANATYYPDGTHPSQAAQDELFPVFDAVLAAAIAAP